MESKLRHRLEEVTVTLDVSGVEARQMPYSSAGSWYAPDVVVLTYQRKNRQPSWECSVNLHGHRLKKDGTSSSSGTREHLWDSDPQPGWVSALVEQYQP